MSVSVVVPYRPDGGHRDRVWQWVAGWWADRYPDWQVVVGRHDDGPWCKAAAVADALPEVTGDILVVADADVVTEGVGAAAYAVEAGAPWAIPHTLVYRLDEAATTDMMAGNQPDPTRLARRPYVGVKGGGMVVLPRATYDQVPIDRRFVGWGSEDSAFGLALTALAGQPWRSPNRLFHLWHPPAPRLNAHVGSRASNALHVRYQLAARDIRAMRRLVSEGATHAHR